jgi:hypothetical protein
MSTPSYLGSNQPTGSSGGWLNKLGSYFGGSGTPAYAAAGQPATTNANASSNTPAYAPAPAPQTEATGPKTTCICMQVEEPEVTGCPIDPDALAAGQIAIVIPRQGS